MDRYTFNAIEVQFLASRKLDGATAFVQVLRTGQSAAMIVVHIHINPNNVYRSVAQCDFRFDLFFSFTFSFSFQIIFSFQFRFSFPYFFVLVFVLVFQSFFSFSFVLVL
jgi:hypothetical protein